MSVECAHCGTRCPDGTTRCPKCLRTTHLEAAPAAPEPPPRGRRLGAVVAVGVGLAALAAVGVALSRPHVATPLAVTAPPATLGPDLTLLVDRAHAEHDRLARARMVAEAFQHRRTATVVSDDDPISHPRAP